MLALHGSYSQEFNRRHGRVGHLFQGRYKAFLVQREKYLLALVRYIHRNPVEAGMVTRAQDFDWSSDREYRTVDSRGWVETDAVLASLSPTRGAAVRAYEAFMNDARGQYEDLESFARLVKGDEEFAVRLGNSHEPEIVKRSLKAGKVGLLVAAALGLDAESFRLSSGRVRGITGHVGKTVGRIPLCRTAELFGKHDTTLVRDVRRLESDMAADSSLRRMVDELIQAVSNAGIQR
jgi:hypothetical protein